MVNKKYPYITNINKRSNVTMNLFNESVSKNDSQPEISIYNIGTIDNNKHK